MELEMKLRGQCRLTYFQCQCINVNFPKIPVTKTWGGLGNDDNRMWMQIARWEKFKWKRTRMRFEDGRYHILPIIGVQLHCIHGSVSAILDSVSSVPYNSFPQMPWNNKKKITRAHFIFRYVWELSLKSNQKIHKKIMLWNFGPEKPCRWACWWWLAHQNPKLFYVLWNLSSPCHCFPSSKL